MLQELGDWILSLRIPYFSHENFTILLFTIYNVVAAFFWLSRRMNARLDAVPPAKRLLPRLTVKQARKKPKLAKLLKAIDWLVYDKLKLLPDAGTGQRRNVFVMAVTPAFPAPGARIIPSWQPPFFRSNC